ncbi:hypothetical protein GM524_13655, partial [Streptococcus pneumoniae]|uniref:hypothetical protein n=1 Tax=Streptococcus pneumoniae TaxID=1313 RepID=UPI0013272AC3
MEQQLAIAARDYAERIGKPDLIGARAKAAPAPAPQPRPTRPEPPMTLAALPSTATPSIAEGRFAQIDAMVERGDS